MMDAAIRTSESLSSRTIAGGPAPGEIRLDYSLAGRGFRQLELSPPDETNDRSRLPPMPAPKPAPAYVRRLEPLGYTRNSMLEVYVDIAESGEIGEQGLESVTQPAGGSVGMSLPSESSLPASASRPCATHPKVKRRRADEANVGHDGTLLAAAAAGHGGSSQSDTLPAKKRRKIVVPGRIKCPICLRMPESGWHTTRCGHVFCDECISNVKSAKKCAACQSNVKPKDVRKLFL
ncbi:MAG: hypothetical protein BJ554DRAFT_563 [Olpidium bornovanus]|uniref:RING-type domain-containing protein n=1 Tax=Olpidium bornovanus TaxID=278681 RepID=A0A8H7ZTC7_9FUNG|nr:MAG: hypothetical protein BJ554DRAFT_563 [Olpidium bornovanus]